MFVEKMSTEATPERVYMLMRVLQEGKGALTRAQAQEKMEPKALGNETNYFTYYFNVARELGLIEENDGALSVKESVSESLESFDSFRRMINLELQNYRRGPFYRVTQSYMQAFPQIIKVYGDTPSLNNMNIQKVLTDQIDRSEMPVEGDVPFRFDLPQLRAWRFWASALGFGRLSGKDGMIFLANPARYLNDLILNRLENGLLEADKDYAVSEVIDILLPDLNLLITSRQIQNRELPYTLTSALLTLQPDILEAYSVLDAETWRLDPNAIDPNETDPMISMIKFKKGISHEQ